jgi:glycosyltransferase involved in cell wall biosynthesis
MPESHFGQLSRGPLIQPTRTLPRETFMLDFEVSVVITTYNRSHLLARAIESVLSQDWHDLEIVVLDDCSTDDTPELIAHIYPQVRYVRQDTNRGVCAARNRGLREASRPWVVFLDDDDTLLPGALGRISSRIAELRDPDRYPVFQFAHSNGSAPLGFLIARLDHFFTGTLSGDFIPVIRREQFSAAGFAYPEDHRVGEGLLWWRVAERFGIPTWADRIASVHTDAPTRLTSVDYQILHARDFARLQECILTEFGDVLAARFPAHHDKKRLGAAAYRLLAGHRTAARSHLVLALQRRLSAEALGLWMLTFLPQSIVRRFYAVYRQRTNAWPAHP